MGSQRRDIDFQTLRYILLGGLGGILYAVANNAMDYWYRHGLVARAFVATHHVVDDVVPIAVGALLGIAIHYVRLRAQLVRDEQARAAALRERLTHVERDQAVWVVAAATLHELKNPLHTMGLLADELVAAPDLATARELAERIRHQLDRARGPLDGLRAMARRGAGVRGDKEPIADIVASVVHELDDVSRRSGIDLRAEGDAPRSACADATFLRIILENLIGNSLEGLRHDARGGRIRVRFGVEGDDVALSVSDDGPGLEHPDALFRPLETSKDGGLGLGLAIARALARAMNGELACTNDPSWSTTFRVTLPAATR